VISAWRIKYWTLFERLPKQEGEAMNLVGNVPYFVARTYSGRYATDAACRLSEQHLMLAASSEDPIHIQKWRVKFPWPTSMCLDKLLDTLQES